MVVTLLASNGTWVWRENHY